MKDTTVFLVSATPLKPLNRISWNFVVMKDIMCRCAYPQEILIPFFFSVLRPFWTSKFDQNERYYSKQFVSAIPLKPLNRISWNYVIMKDIMWRCPYPQEILIQLFDLFKEQFISLLNFGQNYFLQLRWNWFSVWLPVTNATNCHSLYTAFSSNVGAWGMEECWTKSQDVRFGEQPTYITCPFDIFGYVLELFLMSKIVWNTCKCSTSKTDTIVVCRYLYRCNCKFSTSRWRSNEEAKCISTKLCIKHL